MKKKLIVSVGLAAFCLWLSVRGVDWREVWEAFRGVHWGWIALLPFCMFATFYFRTRRWRILLHPVQQLKISDLFGINAVGFMAINLFPFRLGEFTRPILLSRKFGISFSTGLATVAAERLWDALSAAFILTIGLFTVPSGKMTVPLLNVDVKAMASMALIILIPFTFMLMLAVIFRTRAIRLIEWLTQPFSKRVQDFSVLFLQNFLEGLRTLPNPRAFSLLTLESFGVWGAMILAYGLGFKAFGLVVPWTSTFTVLGIVIVGISLPGAPGSVGTFQIFVVAALMLFGIPKSTGFAFSIVMHAINIGYIVIAGLIYLPSMSTNFRNLYSETKLSTSQSPG